jgi:probable phosphoglycerate mutase
VTQPQRARQPQIFDRAFLTDMEEVTQVILIRHGEQYVPDYRAGPVGDTFDPPLSERGERQAELVGLRFSTQRVDAVYSSPLRRALETGRQVARHHRLEPTVWDDLREVEIFRGVPANKPAAEFIGADLLAGIRQRMLYERSWDVYPYSESSHEFRKRTVNAIEAIIAANEGKRVVVTCHGGVINAYIGHIIRSPFDMFFRPAHTSVNVIAAAEGFRALHSLNDIHHLQTGEGSFVSH